jgi:molybdopterin-guanine dinucleotide biosynthesis protein A
MDWAASIGAEAVVSVAADTPFFPRDLVAQLQTSAGPSGLALAATREGGKLYRQPTFGLWPVALRDDLRAALLGGLRKVVLWTDSHGAGTAEFGTDPFDPFFNINTPDDIAIAETLVPA